MWYALMLAGIRLSKDLTTVVALGIDADGNKHVLDFVLGRSKSLDIARELMGRNKKCGFRCEHRLHVVLDGSDALRGGGQRVIQR
jgi:transposase-like protein